MPDLKGKVALITGASSGIGAATAEHFASLGASLVLCGRNEANLEATKQKCGEVGKWLEMDQAITSQVLTIQCDVTKEEELKSLVDGAIKHFGKIDILVNSAGVIINGGVTTSTLEAYDETMNVNVRSIIQLCQLVTPHLIKTKGTIVNLSSIAGPCSFPGVTFYCISKAAIDQLTKCLALELAPQGVRVNAVNPGVIITDIHKRAGMTEEAYAKFLEHCKSTHALGRVGEAMEVAKAIAFLASDDASFTTGELLKIDGGRGLLTPR